MGSSSDGGAGALRAQAQENMRKAAKALEGIDLPDVTKMQLALEYPDLILSSPEEKIRETAFELIEEDPRLRDVQEEALAEMRERGEVGLTPEDRARFETLRRDIAEDEQARQASILQNLAERGQLGSGQELATRLASSQAATQRGAEGAMQLGAQSAAARREALARAAQMGSQMSTEDYRKAAQLAGQRDALAEFNAAVAARDTAARRQQAQQKAQTSNIMEERRASLPQQQFSNVMSKQGALAGAYTGQANLLNQQAAMVKPERSGLSKVLSGAAMGAGTGGQIGGGMGAGIGAGVGGILGGVAKDGGVKYANGGNKTYISSGSGNPSDMGKTLEATAMDNNSNDSFNLESEDISAIVGALGKITKQPEQKTYTPSPVSIGSSPQVQNVLQNQLPNLVKPVSRYQFEDGGYDNTDMYEMGYQEGGMQTDGRIVPGENYAGDELPDRINSGEMVLNVEQQDRLNELLQKFKQQQKGRIDDRLEDGEIDVNPVQQEALMEVLRGERPVEALPNDDVVEEREESSELVKLMQMLQR